MHGSEADAIDRGWGLVGAGHESRGRVGRETERERERPRG